MSECGSLTMINNLEMFFAERTKNLLKHYQETTRAYIVNVLKSAKKESKDYSKDSLTIIYSKAKSEQNFELFQNIADWILFTKSLYPISLNGASEEYYNALAQDSYYRCYRLLNRQWLLFEELADKFPQTVKLLQIMFVPDEKHQQSFWLPPMEN
jgi:hypothetical protein